MSRTKAALFGLVILALVFVAIVSRREDST